MKRMDEVKLQSSVEALEALCADFKDAPQWPAIRQNLDALREVLRDGTDGVKGPEHLRVGGRHRNRRPTNRRSPDMGTRADFYERNGEAIEWLGSVAWDGYLWAEEEDSAIREAKTPEEFRAAVIAELDGREDATLPEEGWPWPWDDSLTTDYAYLFDGDKLRIFQFGREVNEDRETAEKWGGFPNMAERKNVQWGAKSGVIVVSGR